MALFERFGEFDSVEELNMTAEGLKEEGDIESLKVLAVRMDWMQQTQRIMQAES